MPDPVTTVVEAIQTFNEGREPERLAIKLAKMRESPFVFLRGASHLFYDTMPDHPALNEAPLAWACGDLHFENFGSYKADNRLVYFDISDFDDAALAPCTWDVMRLLTSIHCGADALNTSADEASAVASHCLQAWREAMVAGKALWVERETSDGLVKDLFDDLRDNTRADFLNRRTVRKGDGRRLRVDGEKALPATDEDVALVTRWVGDFARTQADPAFFEARDVARRIAGTGSLGLARYVVLVEGKGSPDRNFLLDIKEARPSALAPRLARLGVAQPAWADESTRIFSVQRLMQAVDHAFLHAIRPDGKAFVLKALQPSEDRVAIGEWGKRIERLEQVVATLGRVLAWDQLRSAGRHGAASADALIAFARRDDWTRAMHAAVTAQVQTARAQWATFCAAVS